MPWHEMRQRQNMNVSLFHYMPAAANIQMSKLARFNEQIQSLEAYNPGGAIQCPNN